MEQNQIVKELKDQELKDQIVKELKDHLLEKCQSYKLYRMTLSSDEDLARLEKLDSQIDSIRGILYRLTGEERYNPDKEVEAKLDELNFKIMCLAMIYGHKLTTESIEQKFKEYINKVEHPEDFLRDFNHGNKKKKLCTLIRLMSNVKYNQLANDYAKKDISEIENLKIEF